MAHNEDDLDIEPVHEPADRGMPSINQRSKPGLGQKLVVGMVAIVVVLALVAVNGGFSSEKEDDSRLTVSNDEIGNRLGPAPELPRPPLASEPVRSELQAAEIIRTGQVVPPPAPNYPAATRHREKDQEPTPEDRKRASLLLAFGHPSRPQGDQGQMAAEEHARQMAMAQSSVSGSAMMMDGQADRADGLGAQLEPTSVEGARASLIADRNMFITRGAFLDCALETAISSDVPGMTSCRLTRDVYSTSGKVLLIERGSRMTGQYKGGLQRGKARIFVLWTRVETPNGVVVNLDSPGTDALGRSGHSGDIDSHFWDRFGGAIMLSLIDDVGTYLANEASSNEGGNNQIQFGGTAEAARNSAGIALENSINIPDTLYKNQGEHINIYVARDLDFRGVYDLTANY
ncbi:hypothetical protein GCM10011348_28320 [Marinobacterium nitratireducens]|uniref:Type IV secretion system protein VirB10 n=1 Tax=Marinobacterium nitratireducens TaxID=518897 RepID=A0A918DTZ2_9GAMM|nr:type IV secretion system protein VirB10 [Marinobacterium nitratireducens]GGO83772.1 hypothetical protein GCM10011348_28320 [Marinobacterium nitratireducens]